MVSMYARVCIFVFLVLGFLPVISTTLPSEEKILVTRNRTMVSNNDDFELGFFNLENRWYLGVWYKKLAERTYVWIANRDSPLQDSLGSLGIFESELVLRNQFGQVVWSSQSAGGNERSPVVADLMDNGNFVLRYSDNNNPEDFLWQSFDFPTDTLIPGMKLGFDFRKPQTQRFLSSWKDLDDPSSGIFIFKLDVKNIPTLSIIYQGFSVFRSGPWNGERFIGLPWVFNFSHNTEESSCIFTPTGNISSYPRLVMAHSGLLILFTWNQTATKWNWIWNSVNAICNIYNYCGSNAYCDMSTAMCTCLEGFEPRDAIKMISGCVRKTPLVCGGNRFRKLVNMSFRNTLAPMHYDWINKEEKCRKMCIADCKCTAYSLTNTLQVSSSSCVVWREDLADLRRYSADGLNLYLKLEGKDTKKRLSRLQWGFIIGGTIGGVIVLTLLSFWLRKKVTTTSTNTNIAMGELRGGPAGSTEDLSTLQIEYRAIVEATQNFSQEIGEGGFGKVFKGKFSKGQEIAVKKLSEISSQGKQEFDNEVRSIARLQHINIVRLLGWCDQNNEKLLVYEFLANGSLESHLFGGYLILDWPSRYNIIKGIARGLEYMESGWRSLIVHRDLKPANILLDSDLTPKISDFGLSRMCLRTQSEAFTHHSAGTRSYMSPEYMANGIFSAQSDIYSFGVTVLEVVSGIKHKRAASNYTDITILAWTKLVENKLTDFLDQKISQDSLIAWDEVKRCVELSMLCVQPDPKDRPKMSTVLGMLEDKNLEIPESERPEFRVIVPQRDIPSTSDSASTSNLFTISDIPGR